MMKALAIALGLLVAGGALAQAQNGNPGSVFIPQGVGTPIVEDEPEVESDIKMFVEAGFNTPLWKSYGSVVDGVKEDLIVPDYENRMGTKPGFGFIEVAIANLTGGRFNDMIVMSHLPGDCGVEGCLVQIWSMMANTWFKRLEFTATGVAWKKRKDGTMTLAAVGDMDTPSYLFEWDGTGFQRAR